MTIGLTWRRTARRIKRLKQTVLAIYPDYLESPEPRLFDVLPSRIAYNRRRQFRRANNGASSARNRKRGTVFSKISLGGLPEETNRIFNP